MRTKYKQWAVDCLAEHPEVVINTLNLEDKFFIEKKVIFEIGSGKGDFICGIAKLHPEFNFLAVERVPTVAGIMTKKVVDQAIENVRVFPNDAKIIFDSIKDGFAEKIYLNFVDPWPKKKHAKRRLTYISFLENYYKILKKDGLLIFKSDNDGLYEFTLEELAKTKFKIEQNVEDYKFDSTDDVMTEYELKFREKGQKIHRIVVRK